MNCDVNESSDENYLLRCLNCEGQSSKYDENDKRYSDAYENSCKLCDRFFNRGLLFLNNVG